jgi:hypothetical protein
MCKYNPNFTTCLESNRNSVYKHIWIQLIIYYNSYVYNEILNYIIKFNYIIWNTLGNELN